MNYLAHVVLSGDNPDVQVGGLLGDFVKGPVAESMPVGITAGIYLHRRIDSATDNDPAFRLCRADLPPPWRRFGGILLDVYFDHLLACDWPEFAPGTLDSFCRDFYRTLNARYAYLPERARFFADRAPEVRWLESYGTREALPLMLDNLGKRLRRPVPLGSAWPLLESRRDELRTVFRQLMASHRGLAETFLRNVP